MGIVRVDTTELRALAEQAQTLASELLVSNAPAVASKTWQPSVGAVNAVNTALFAAAKTLASRMSTTAEKLSASSTGYAAQDEHSAAGIQAVKL